MLSDLRLDLQSRYIANWRSAVALAAALTTASSAGAVSEPLYVAQGTKGLPASTSITGGAPVNEDVLLMIDPSIPLAMQRWRVQCDGRFTNADALAMGGEVRTSPLSSGQTGGFSLAPDPAGSGRQVFQFRVQADGPKIGGSPRCEVGFFKRNSQSLPRDRIFWHAFSLWLEDWSATNDRMAISQWYHGQPGAQLNPPFVLVASGKELWADLRFSEKEGRLRKADQSLKTLFKMSDGSFYKRWLHIVIRAKLSARSDDDGFLTMYIDGKLVADYRGPIGYAAAGAEEHAVHGIYPLVKGKFPFDLSMPGRRMYLGRSLVVSDPTEKYKPQDLLKALD